MAIMAEAKGNFEQPETGTWPARCYSIIDLGTQQGEWQGQHYDKYQVLVSWELPTQEPMDDGRPKSISKFYTLSLSDKANLTKDLQSWRGKAFTEEEKAGFDITKLIGAPCMLSLVEKNDKVKVDAVMGMPKGTPIPDQINKSVIFELQDYINGNTTVYDDLSEGLQKLINKAKELNPDTVEGSMARYPKGSAAPAQPVDDFDDDIPF